LFSASPAPVRPVSAVSAIYRCRLGARAPYRPDDAGQLVGHGHGGLVVDVALGEFVGPGAEAVRLLVPGVQQHGAGAMDEQAAQVAVAALGDAPQVALEAAGELAGGEAQVTGQVAARGKRRTSPMKATRAVAVNARCPGC
jgi:hypothetical protein